MRTIRSFIAVNLGIQAVRAIADEQSRLRRAAAARGLEIRWAAPQNLHITLAFLGQVTEPMVTALEDGLETVAKAAAPFELTAKGLGVFPESGPPRVVWVGLDDPAGALTRLHASISEVLGRMGFDLDDKSFRSHVTIGRVKSGDAEALAAFLSEFGEKSYGAFNVRDLACYRSDLSPKGADYHMLWRLPLGAKSRVPRFAAPSDADNQSYQDGSSEQSDAEIEAELEAASHGGGNGPTDTFDNDRESKE